MSETKERRIPQLDPGHENMSAFEYVSTRWDAKIAIGVTPSDLLDPSFWAHHAIQLKPMDEIRARGEDGTWIGYYVVLDCSRNWAKVHQLALHTLTTSDVSQSKAEVQTVKSGCEIAFRGPKKWSVLRKSDRAVLVDGLDKGAAEAWLDRYAREQVGGAALTPEPETA